MQNEWVKRNKWIFVVAPLALVGFLAICGEVVLHLWNWLAPALFGWHPITFWQALGLLVLCRLLFGGLGSRGGSGRGKWRRDRAERWEKMTPEEREKLRQGLRGRCGPFGPPAGGTNEPA
jgi:hypothetical protein